MRRVLPQDIREGTATMSTGRELMLRRGLDEAAKVSLAAQVFAPNGPMAMEHAGQSGWEQGAVGTLCAVGGYLLAYWSLQGFIGLAVIVLCVAFSTLVTAALCHYYDRVVRSDDEKPKLGVGRRSLKAGLQDPSQAGSRI